MSTATDTPRTILVVDDFDDTRLLLRTWLERRGFRVIEAENGLEAIDQAETESPDLIIMDMQMPQLGGLQVIRMMRELRKALLDPERWLATSGPRMANGTSAPPVFVSAMAPAPPDGSTRQL